MRCPYYWDPEVIKHFENDKQMRPIKSNSLLKKRLYEGLVRCYKEYGNHKQCYRYKDWKKQHPGEQRILMEEASKHLKLVYILLKKTVRVHGKDITANRGIKSSDPPCLQEAMAHGKHPLTCSNCPLQDRALKNTLQHERTGSLKDNKNRLGLTGFNKRYARKGECRGK